jgi:hypothetical protein
VPLGLLTKNTTPAITEPTVNIKVSLKSVLSRPTKNQDSGDTSGHCAVVRYNKCVTMCQSELLL